MTKTHLIYPVRNKVCSQMRLSIPAREIMGGWVERCTVKESVGV